MEHDLSFLPEWSRPWAEHRLSKTSLFGNYRLKLLRSAAWYAKLHVVELLETSVQMLCFAAATVVVTAATIIEMGGNAMAHATEGGRFG